MIETDGDLDQANINVGNPDNECSIANLAERLVGLFEERRARIPDYRAPQIAKVDAESDPTPPWCSMHSSAALRCGPG